MLISEDTLLYMYQEIAFTIRRQNFSIIRETFISGDSL